MKKYIFILSCLFVLTISCEDAKQEIYEDLSLTYFTDSTSGTYYVQDSPDSTFEITVGVTDVSSSDRTFSIAIDDANSTVTTDQYSIDNNLVIPANSHIGTLTIYGEYANIVSGSTLVLSLTDVDNSNIADFDNTFTLNFYQFCPFVRDEFLGAWDADEIDYAVYDVTVTAGAADNEILISNVWDVDPSSTTRVFLDDSDPSNFVLDFPIWSENYLYNNATYGPAYIDNAYGTFNACDKIIDMYFQVRVDAGFFSETHIIFTKQ